MAVQVALPLVIRSFPLSGTVRVQGVHLYRYRMQYSTVQCKREGEREEPARHIGALARSAVLSFLPLIITGVAMATAATRSRSVQHYAASLPPSLFYLSLFSYSPPSLSLLLFSKYDEFMLQTIKSNLHCLFSLNRQ